MAVNDQQSAMLAVKSNFKCLTEFFTDEKNGQIPIYGLDISTLLKDTWQRPGPVPLVLYIRTSRFKTNIE